jgi:dTDP-glucose 4,6-dehydratase
MPIYLVTGGAGFIGSNFVHYILEKYSDAKVVVFDKLTYAGNRSNLSRWDKDSRFRFVQGDIADQSDVESIVSSQDFDFVVHFAAESHVDRSILDPKSFVITNILGTFTLLEAFRKKWGKNRKNRFLHVSTDEVYGSLDETGYFTEESNYAPNSPYSATKAGSDHLVRAYYHTYGMNVVTSNSSNNFGPYQYPEKFIPVVILSCLFGKKIPVYGKGLNTRDWLYVKDHCSALDTILHKGRAGETYNIGTRNEKKNIDLVYLICDLMDKLKINTYKHRELIQFVPDRPGHDLRYAIDPTKLERELGWKAESSFAQSLEYTVKWYMENQDWWKV